MKRFCAGLLVVGCAFAAPAQVPAGAAPQAPAVTADQGAVARMMYLLQSDPRYAYRPFKPDDAGSARLFNAYVDVLDGQKVYLSEADLAALRPPRNALGDAAKRGDLRPAMEIFEKLRESAVERLAFARTLLAEPMSPDRTGYWQPDRERASRAADRAGLDALWRGLVRNDVLDLELAGYTPGQISESLEARYAGDVRRIVDATAEEVGYGFFDAFAKAVAEGGAYYPPGMQEARNDLVVNGPGFELVRRGRYPEVARLTPGGPAQASGKVAVGDRLLAVAEGGGVPDDVVGLPLDQITRRLRGAQGSAVTLKLLPAHGPARTVPLARGPVTEFAGSTLLPVDGRRIGVIRPNSFYVDYKGRSDGRADVRSASRDVALLVAELQRQGMDGLVFDLRGNQGGALSEVMGVAGLFLGPVPVVQVRESGGRVMVLKGESPEPVWTGPLAVLVDQRTASGAEMFAAAIQDHRRGLVVGQRTFGRGAIHSLFDLDSRLSGSEPGSGMLKMTIGEAFRPRGDNLDPGIAPDIEFLPAVKATRPALRIPSVPGVRHEVPPPDDLPMLAAAHDARARQGGDFRRWRDGELAAQAAWQRNEASLDEQARRAEAAMAGSSTDDPVELREAAAVLADSLGQASAQQ